MFQKYSILFILAIFILSGCNSVNFNSTQQPESLEASSQTSQTSPPAVIASQDESIIAIQISTPQISQIISDSVERIVKPMASSKVIE